MSPAPDGREAFAELVAETYRPLLRYLARRTDPATAEDVLGDTLLVMWRRFADVPGDARLPWCLGVARGCLANRRRSDERHLRLVRRLASEAATRVDASTDPALDEALDRLGEKDRELLRLWAWDGLAPREIAVVLGITPNAASVRLHRATARLRALLAGKDGATAGHLTDRQEAVNE
jgi:RNA polymerase sigma-70 factor (ECF subfamily)